MDSFSNNLLATFFASSSSEDLYKTTITIAPIRDEATGDVAQPEDYEAGGNSPWSSCVVA